MISFMKGNGRKPKLIKRKMVRSKVNKKGSMGRGGLGTLFWSLKALLWSFHILYCVG